MFRSYDQDQMFLLPANLHEFVGEGHPAHLITVEPCFGQIKLGMGFRRLFYRGRQKVCAEWNLVCAAFNMKKIAALQQTKRGAPNPDPLNRRSSACLPFVAASLTRRLGKACVAIDERRATFLGSRLAWALP